MSFLQDLMSARNETQAVLRQSLSLSRSIQKLEEMNVGIDHRGEDMMAQLGQQWNGLTGNNSTSSPRVPDTRHTPDKGPPRDKPGGVSSSTPVSTGSHSLPLLSESPVPPNKR